MYFVGILAPTRPTVEKHPQPAKTDRKGYFCILANVFLSVISPSKCYFLLTKLFGNYHQIGLLPILTFSFESSQSNSTQLLINFHCFIVLLANRISMINGSAAKLFLNSSKCFLFVFQLQPGKQQSNTPSLQRRTGKGYFCILANVFFVSDFTK